MIYREGEQVISCSDAIAFAVKQARPRVIACYPITPQTWIVEKLAELINNGEMRAKMIPVESEHSAASVCLGAQATGVRTFSATNSQGLLYMFEVLHAISGLRLPTVFALANRAISAPINIWCDHSDIMNCRDASWISFHCESSQEAYDTILQAYKISEDKRVLLPCFVNVDGFNLSHVYERVNIEIQNKVNKFLPEYKPVHAYLKPNKPLSIGALAYPDSYMEFKHQQAKAMNNAREVIKRVSKEFNKTFNRSYGNGLIEKYGTRGAKTILVCMGSVCGTIKSVINKERERIGLVRVRSFRPFPKKELSDALSNAERIAVLDRAYSYGSGGPLYIEVNNALKENNVNVSVKNYVIGLGGREVTKQNIKFIINNVSKRGERIKWVNVND